MKSLKIFTLCFACFVILLSSCNKQYIKTQEGFTTEVDATIIEVQFFSPEIVRVVKSKKGFEFEKESLAVIKEAKQVPFSISTGKGLIEASTNKMKVTLDIATLPSGIYILKVSGMEMS